VDRKEDGFRKAVDVVAKPAPAKRARRIEIRMMTAGGTVKKGGKGKKLRGPGRRRSDLKYI
jgi:hypothetical protein